jgi:hypothetical protein
MDLLREITGVKKRTTAVTSKDWSTAMIEYASDHYGDRGEMAIQALIDMSFYLGLDAPQRARHRSNLLKRIDGDERFAEELELGICHFTNQSHEDFWAHLAPNGFDLVIEEERDSPADEARRGLLPSTSPLFLNRYSPYKRQILPPARKKASKDITWHCDSVSRYSGLWAFLKQSIL